MTASIVLLRYRGEMRRIGRLTTVGPSSTPPARSSVCNNHDVAYQTRERPSPAFGAALGGELFARVCLFRFSIGSQIRRRRVRRIQTLMLVQSNSKELGFNVYSGKGSAGLFKASVKRKCSYCYCYLTYS